MSDDTLVYDTSNLQEVLFDDIRDLSIHNGIFRCTLYAFRVVPPCPKPVWVPVLPLAMPVAAVVPVARKALEMVASDAVTATKDFVRDAIGLLTRNRESLN
jgi:hypothetical protein